MLESLSSIIISWAGLGSAIIGAAGFVIGSRVGKNNADRSALREIYTALFNHIRDIQEKISIGAPRNWEDYPLKENRYMPLVRDLDATGKINLISKKLATRLLKVETDALIAGSKWSDCAKNVICPETERICRKKIVGLEKSKEGLSYRVLHASTFLLQNDDYLKQLIKDVETQNLGLGFELSIEKGRTRQLYVYQENIKEGTLSDFLQELRATLLGLSEVTDIIEEINNQKNELLSLRVILSKRINDPTPLLETLKQSLYDLF